MFKAIPECVDSSPIRSSILKNEDVENDGRYYRVKADMDPLEDVAKQLEEHIFGQPRAIRALSSALVRVAAGMNVGQRPEFSGLFLGPPGVGKTETGRALAKFYHPYDEDWEKYLRIIDCSNLAEPHSISKLIGSAPGYVGSGNTGMLLIKPDFFMPENRTVVVFDEFEKASLVAWRQMLSILDRGVLTITAGSKQYASDTSAVETDWSGTSVIFTTNIGSKQMVDAQRGKRLGFNTPTVDSSKKIVEIGLEAVREYFAEIPEFLDRLDTVVVFDSLTADSYAKILNQLLVQLNSNQRYGSVHIDLTQEARNYIISLTNNDIGGRGVRRAFEREVMTPAASLKLSLGNNPLVVGYDNEEKGVLFWASKTCSEEKIEFVEAAVTEVKAKAVEC